MTIQVKFYGDLKKKISNQKNKPGFPVIIQIDHGQIETISDILRRYSIQESEIYHIFVNGKYSSVTKKIKDGDNVAIFPINMSLLYKWYFKREE
ncbi:MAG: hypothetical protein EU539_04265 [Promethearchaeota archaeon]|nr:MAG: hypothetical protein EU539_04265 [Candidatus Lokiarchaeota archaeon]